MKPSTAGSCGYGARGRCVSGPTDRPRQRTRKIRAPARTSAAPARRREPSPALAAAAAPGYKILRTNRGVEATYMEFVKPQMVQENIIYIIYRCNRTNLLKNM